MTLEQLLGCVRFDVRGLAPVIVQDAESKDVLMLAWVNEQALRASWESGYAHYWSRSRKKLWKKGETSGNVQKIKQICIDCDADALLFVVEQTGFACHTGTWSCFSNRCASPPEGGR